MKPFLFFVTEIQISKKKTQCGETGIYVDWESFCAIEFTVEETIMFSFSSDAEGAWKNG